MKSYVVLVVFVIAALAYGSFLLFTDGTLEEGEDAQFSQGEQGGTPEKEEQSEAPDPRKTSDEQSEAPDTMKTSDEQIASSVPVQDKGLPSLEETITVNGAGVAVVTNQNELYVVVNKERALPEGYIPPDLVEPNVRFSFEGKHEKKQLRKPAAEALEKLFAAADQENIHLFAVSGYRSYQTQEYLFNYYVERDGIEAAKRYSAWPGHSEHQTGLAMDVSSQSAGFTLEEDFADTVEGKWLAEHAQEYGFIIRYPREKEEVTGYAYEPWHLRYVGTEIAQDIFAQQVTLEEYFEQATPVSNK